MIAISDYFSKGQVHGITRRSGRSRARRMADGDNEAQVPSNERLDA
jgi:hypothetical protein